MATISLEDALQKKATQSECNNTENVVLSYTDSNGINQVGTVPVSYLYNSGSTDTETFRSWNVCHKPKRYLMMGENSTSSFDDLTLLDNDHIGPDKFSVISYNMCTAADIQQTPTFSRVSILQDIHDSYSIPQEAYTNGLYSSLYYGESLSSDDYGGLFSGIKIKYNEDDDLTDFQSYIFTAKNASVNPNEYRSFLISENGAIWNNDSKSTLFDTESDTIKDIVNNILQEPDLNAKSFCGSEIRKDVGFINVSRLYPSLTGDFFYPHNIVTKLGNGNLIFYKATGTSEDHYTPNDIVNEDGSMITLNLCENYSDFGVGLNVCGISYVTAQGIFVNFDNLRSINGKNTYSPFYMVYKGNRYYMNVEKMIELGVFMPVS